MLRKAYLYMRFSSAEQAKGDSLERQRSLATEYVALHPEKQIELVEELQFVDEGVSSFNGQNLQPGRGLHRVLECIKDGRIAAGSILMVESLDRLSRQQVLLAQSQLLDILLSGISVITTSPAERKEYDGRSGLTDLITSLAGMERANQESKLKSDRVRRAWKRKKDNAATVKLTSRGPSWLKLNADRKFFSVVEEKAAVVRRIFELAETLGQQSIVRVLNNEGVPTLVRGTGGWHESSVAKVLANPAVIGVYQPHGCSTVDGRTRRVPDGAPVDDYYPAVVDSALFYRVQAFKAARKTAGAGRKGLTYTNIFGGIAKCAHCGASMVVIDKGASPKGGQYFVCSAARRGSGCTYRSVRYGHCERGFMLYCQRIDVSEILPGGAIKTEAAKLRKGLSALHGEMNQKSSLVDRLVASVEANGGDMPKAIQRQIAQHETRMEAIVSDVARLSSELAVIDGESYRIAGMQASFTELFQRLRVATDEEKFVLRSKLHAVLKTAISRIEIGAAETSIRDAITALAKEQRASLITHHRPNAESEAKALGMLFYPPLKGPITAFNVFYKNGNTYELFIDGREAVAGRMTYTDEAVASAKVKGSRPDSALSLTYGYQGTYEVHQPVRDGSGKFIKSPRADSTPVPA